MSARSVAGWIPSTSCCPAAWAARVRRVTDDPDGGGLVGDEIGTRGGDGGGDQHGRHAGHNQPAGPGTGGAGPRRCRGGSAVRHVDLVAHGRLLSVVVVVPDPNVWRGCQRPAKICQGRVKEPRRGGTLGLVPSRAIRPRRRHCSLGGRLSQSLDGRRAASRCGSHPIVGTNGVCFDRGLPSARSYRSRRRRSVAGPRRPEQKAVLALLIALGSSGSVPTR